MGPLTSVSKLEKKPERKINYFALQKSMEKAIQNRIPKNQRIGIAFSGGLDSGVLAFLMQKIAPNATLLVAGTKKSKDFARAEAVANKLKMRLVKKELTEKEIKSNYELAGKILQTKDHLQQTLGVVNLAVAQLAQENEIHTLFVGSGADELFCGYAAFEKCRNNAVECEALRTQKMENIEEHDVKREKMCGEHYGITLQAPYLDPAFVQRVLQIPAIQNLSGKYGKIRKNVLRVLAEKMGVDEEIIHAPKKAMQYGSGVGKIVSLQEKD